MKILVFAGFGRSLVNFRGPLLKSMVAAGHVVVGIAPADHPDLQKELAAIGVRFAPLTLARAGLNPFADIAVFLRLLCLMLREKPDVVLSYTIKPIIHGSLAARMAGVPGIYALNTGLGAAFNTPGLKGRILLFVASRLYQAAFRCCNRVIVQNPDIASFLVHRGIVTGSARIAIVLGSGVDTRAFAPQPISSGAPVFLLLGRMLRDKGIVEYVTAARLVRARVPTARFLLVGDVDPNPASLSPVWLQGLNQEGVIEYRPAVKDVRPLLAKCTCYVLPSYHEGLPRTVLEAMATERPIITTDVFGCRETVLEVGGPDAAGVRTGRNGLLVPHANSNALAAAMIYLAGNPALAAAMARESRIIAETQFDVDRINEQMLSLMDLTPAVAGTQ